MEPLVSILIPARNAARWLPQAMASAAAQTWPHCETIIVDDGSTDGTGDVARALAGPHVRVIARDPHGASAARNAALRAARGDFIQYLDADDVLHPEKIRHQVAAAAALPEGTLLSSSWMRLRRGHPDHRPCAPVLWGNFSPAAWLQTKMETNSWMAIQAWLLPRALVARTGPWDESLSANDDGEYFARAVSRARSVHFVPDAWSFVRESSPHSLSHPNGSRRWAASQLRSVLLQIDCLLALEDGARSRAAARQALQDLLPLLEPRHPDLASTARAEALRLGAPLADPPLRTRYRMLAAFVGENLARRLQGATPRWTARLRERAWRLSPLPLRSR